MITPQHTCDVELQIPIGGFIGAGVSFPLLGVPHPPPFLAPPSPPPPPQPCRIPFTCNSLRSRIQNQDLGSKTSLVMAEDLGADVNAGCLGLVPQTLLVAPAEGAVDVPLLGLTGGEKGGTCISRWPAEGEEDVSCSPPCPSVRPSCTAPPSPCGTAAVRPGTRPSAALR